MTSPPCARDRLDPGEGRAGRAGSARGRDAWPAASEPPARPEPRRWSPGRPTRLPRVIRAATAVAGDIAATDRVPRRVPVPALRPDLSLCAPTGVRARIWQPRRGHARRRRRRRVAHRAVAPARRRGAVARAGSGRRGPDRSRRRLACRGRPYTASTGWPRWTTKARWTTWTPPPGARRCSRRVGALYSLMRQRRRRCPVPGDRDPARRTARLRRRGRDRARWAAR